MKSLLALLLLACGTTAPGLAALDVDGGRTFSDAGLPFGPRADGGAREEIDAGEPPQSDAGVPLVTVDAGVTSAPPPPICNCGPMVERVPLEDMRLSARCEGFGLSYRWSVEDKPEGSRTRVVNVSAADVEARAFLDLVTAGDERYVFRLDATDSLGRTATCRSSVYVRPTERLYIELAWTEPAVNLDLHYLNAEGSSAAWGPRGWFSGNDCSVSRPAPTWPTGENVRVKYEARPEVITSNTLPTRAKIGVVYNCSTEQAVPTAARVRVYCNGTMASERSILLEAVGQFWEATEMTACSFAWTTTRTQTAHGCQGN